MKRVFLLTIACCLFAVKGIGQEPAKEKEKEDSNPNAPVITFEKTVHDFGTVPFKGVAEYEFTFTNTGKEPLIIQDCLSSCGCATPTCPKNKPIKPGEKGTIKAKFNNTHAPGTFNRDFTVVSNAKNSPIKVTIKGEIAQNAEVEKKVETKKEETKKEEK